MALAVMSTLHLEKRVTSIMEVLAKAAVAEICKIIDEGTALLRVEMSGSKKENEALKKKLLQLESKLQAAQRAGKRRAEARENSVKIRSVGVQAGNEVRVAEGSNNEKEHSTLNIESVFGKEWSIRLWRDGGITAMKEEDCPLQPVSREEVPEPVENQLVLLPVKEEMFEEDLGSSESQRVLPVGKENCLESDAVGGERRFSEDQYSLGEEAVPEHRPTTTEEAEDHDAQPAYTESQEECHANPPTVGGTEEPCTPPERTLECTSENEETGGYFLRGKSVNTAKKKKAGNKNSNDKSVHIGQRTLRNRQLSYEHCSKTFSSSYSLRKHPAIHMEKTTSYNEGMKPFSQKININSHLCHTYNTRKKPHKHTNYGKGFPQKINHDLPKCTHKTTKLYSCSTCGISFSPKRIFILHQSTHEGEKPYICKDCGRNFSQKCSLVLHQRTHMRDEVHKCCKCGHCFSQKAHLRSHLRSHNTDKLYKL